MVLVGQPDASFSQTLGTLGHRCIQALLEPLLHLQAMGGETPLVYRGQTCPLYLQTTSCSEQRLPDLPREASLLEQQARCPAPGTPLEPTFTYQVEAAHSFPAFKRSRRGRARLALKSALSCTQLVEASVLSGD